jgi:hypothetical protein
MRDVVVLRDVVIDKGEGTHMLWCGPCLVAAFTGAPLNEAEEALRRVGADCAATTAVDVAAAFALFGFGMRGVYAFPPGREPPLRRFLRTVDARHHAEARLAITVSTPDGSHWVAACGAAMPLVCDSLNGRRWSGSMKRGRTRTRRSERRGWSSRGDGWRAQGGRFG